MDVSYRTVALTCSGRIQVDLSAGSVAELTRGTSVQIVYLRSLGEVLVTAHLCTVCHTSAARSSKASGMLDNMQSQQKFN